MKTKLSSISAAPYLVWMVIFIIVPLIVVIYFAFTDSITGAFTFSNLAAIGDYIPIFLKSVMIAVIASAICLLLGYPVAYFISRTSQKTQRYLIMLIMLPMCMSFLLRTLAWVALLDDTGIINNIVSSLGLKPLPLIRNNSAVVLGICLLYTSDAADEL